jgi:signal transduction histidine kinase
MGAAVSLLGVVASTLLVALLAEVVPVDSLGTIYIAPVVLVAAEWGAALGITTALLSALAFDYFFIAPVFSVRIVGREDWVPLITFLGSVALAALVSSLAARVRVADERRQRAAAARGRIVVAAERERRRVVRDLHDGAQQRIVHAVITLKLAVSALAAGDREQGETLVRQALDHAERANVELRDLAQGLLPSVLARRGLGAAIESVAARMSLPVAVDVRTGRHPPEVESTAYFIVAEALTNVVKHAGATHAEVRVREVGGELRIEVRDDGAGGVALDRGSGLRGLDDRVAAFDGTLTITSPPGAGTRLVATLPLPPVSASPR